MSENIKIKEQYRIAFKNCFFKTVFTTKPLSNDPLEGVDNDSKKGLIDKFVMYDLKISDVLKFQVVNFLRSKYLRVFNICFHEVLFIDGHSSLIMEILDVAVGSKYRNKGIGRQLLSILEEIALENKIEYIIGELQEEGVDEPIDARKRFFEKNDFLVWEDKKSNFSGWVAKKHFKL